MNLIRTICTFPMLVENFYLLRHKYCTVCLSLVNFYIASIYKNRHYYFWEPVVTQTYCIWICIAAWWAYSFSRKSCFILTKTTTMNIRNADDFTTYFQQKRKQRIVFISLVLLMDDLRFRRDDYRSRRTEKPSTANIDSEKCWKGRYLNFAEVSTV